MAVSPEIVEEIRAEVEAGNLTRDEIGRRHGISARTVGRLVREPDWKPRVLWYVVEAADVFDIGASFNMYDLATWTKSCSCPDGLTLRCGARSSRSWGKLTEVDAATVTCRRGILFRDDGMILFGYQGGSYQWAGWRLEAFLRGFQVAREHPGEGHDRARYRCPYVGTRERDAWCCFWLGWRRWRFLESLPPDLREELWLGNGRALTGD